MSFLAAGFLLGLAAVAAPVIIHLIHRQRYPERQFTTLRFFDRTIKHNVLQNRLIDKILLALRVLALCALALGLARPFMNIGLGERRMSMVVILDNSPSMARQKDGQMLFEQARAAARKMIDALGPQDRAEVLLTSPSPVERYTSDRNELKRQLAARAGRPTALFVRGEGGDARSIPQLSTDHRSIAAAIERLPEGAEAALIGFDEPMPRLDGDRARVREAIESAGVSGVSGNVKAVLERAASLLADSSDGDKRIVVLTDLQRGQWGGEAVETLEGVNVVVVPLEPAPAGSNLAIVSASPDRAEASLGSTIGGRALIRNYGPGDSEPAKLIVTAGDRNRPAEVHLPPLAAGETLQVNFPLRVMGRDRQLLCEARIESRTDALDYDNTWRFQAGVRPPVTALCVNGRGAAGSGRSSFYIVNALAPRGGTLMDASVDPRECDVADLKNQQLFQYGVVILCGVEQLDAEARQKLKEFVADGGGLLVFPSAETSPDEYNGWDFLPAKLLEAKSAEFVYVKNLAPREAAVVPVIERVGSGAATLSTNAWLKLEPSEGARVLASFSDGSPALVEAEMGRGRVILAAAGGHLSDSDWPLRPAFVILLRELVAHLGAPESADLIVPDRSVGESAAVRLSPELAEGTSATFRIDAGETGAMLSPLAYEKQDDRLVLPPAASPGHYLLTAIPGKQPGLRRDIGLGGSVSAVSINHDSSESDLPPLATSALETAWPGAKIEVKSLAQEPAALVAEMYSGRDLWRWLLGLALVVLVVESIIAWRWPSDGN
jgi:hypothetical protein